MAAADRGENILEDGRSASERDGVPEGTAAVTDMIQGREGVDERARTIL